MFKYHCIIIGSILMTITVVRVLNAIPQKKSFYAAADSQLKMFYSFELIDFNKQIKQNVKCS